MAYIGKKPEDLIRGNATYNSFTGDGSTTAFDVTNILPDGGDFDVEVFVDNVRQEAGASKSYTIGNDGNGDRKRITFNVAPDNASEIYVINPGRETSLITVADNTISTDKLQATSVTTAKLGADAVTGAKLADDAVDSEHLVDGSVDNVHLAGSIANDKLANSSITINGTAVSLGGSVTAGTDWQAVVVADGSTQLTAVAGKGYFLDTNLGTIDVNLPTSPSRGDTIVLADYGNNFATNRVIVNTGGKLIDSVVGGEPGSSGFTIETNGAVVELVFADDTAGWIIKQNSAPSDLGAEEYAAYVTATGGTVTTSGDFKIHTFTGDGCFVVSCGGNPIGSNTVDYLVVAGGASGGGDRGGGGGAGGVRFYASPDITSYPASPRNGPSSLSVTATTYPITVGGGGAGNCGTGAKGADGSNSVFSTITSTGGGGGGGGQPSNTNANNGGSGGGSRDTCLVSAGTGNTPPVSPPQGSNGGSFSSSGVAGGGGGFMAAGGAGGGQPATSSNGNGGVGGGFPTAFVGTAGEPSGCEQYFGGGGAGGTCNQNNPFAGLGGGGTACQNGSVAEMSATANTGGGGGGGNNGLTNSGSGGKGIVIIRYKFQ